MTETTIITPYARKIVVQDGWEGPRSKHISVSGIAGVNQINALLPDADVDKLAEALLGDNATIITGLPEARMNEWGRVYAGGCDRSKHSDPAEVLTIAKELLAVHAFLTKHNEEQVAAEKAEEEAAKAAAEAEKAQEAARKARRDELVAEFSAAPFHMLSSVAKAAIDRIIELEEAAKVS